MYDMKVAFYSLIIEILPGCSIIFSEIRWKKTRKRVDRAARSFLLKQLGYVIKHLDFENKYSGLFAYSSVVLAKDLSFFLSSEQDVIYLMVS